MPITTSTAGAPIWPPRESFRPAQRSWRRAAKRLVALGGLLLAAATAAAAPVIAVDPAALSATLAPGETATQTLTIRNRGSDALDWSVLDQSTTVQDFRREAALSFDAGEYFPVSAVIDPTGHYAYFGTSSPPGQIVKVDLRTWERVDAITLLDGAGEDAERFLFTAIMDPAGRYAYFGTGTYPGRVVKIDLERFERVGSVTLEFGEDVLRSAAIDPTGRFGYFGADSSPVRIVKVDLETMQRVGSVDLEEGTEGLAGGAAVDPAGQFGYFAAGFGTVVKIDLASFTLSERLDTGIGTFFSPALIDPAGQFIYFGTYSDPGQILKIDLASFSIVDTLTLGPGEARPLSAAMSADGTIAYFGTQQTTPGRVIKVDLANFTRVDAITLDEGEDDVRATMLDPSGGTLYVSTATFPGKVVRLVDVAYDCALPDWAGATPGSGSVAAGSSQTVDVGFDAGGLGVGRHQAALCLQSNDPATPRVAVPLTAEVRVADVAPARLSFDVVRGGTGSDTLSIANHGSGDLAWAVTQADPAQGCGTPAAASWLGASPAGGSIAPGGTTAVGVTVDITALAAGSYAWLLCVDTGSGADAQTRSVAVDLRVSEPVPAFTVDPGSLSMTLPPDQSGSWDLALRNDGAGTLDWTVLSGSFAPYLKDSLLLENAALPTAAVMDPAGRYAYFGTNSIPARVLKIDLTSFETVAAITLPAGEDMLRSAVIDAAGRYAYFGTFTDPGKVIRIDLNSFQRVAALTLQAGEDRLSSAVIDPAGAYAYFGTRTEVGRVVKIDLANFTRAGAIDFSAGEEEGFLISAAIDTAGAYAYFGTGPLVGKAVKVDLATFQRVDSIVLSEDQGISTAMIDGAGRFAYFGTEPPFLGAAHFIKLDLAEFRLVSSIDLEVSNYEGGITAAVIDPLGRYALLGNTWGSATRMVEVDLQDFYRTGSVLLGVTEGGLYSAVMDPAGRYAYFGGVRYPGTNEPGRLLKIESRLDCVLPGWLSVADSSGSVAPGGAQTLAIEVDSAGLADGVHGANLCFGSNDPAQPLLSAAVELVVAGDDRIFGDGFDPAAP
ncbi:BACON domain-containing protein [Dokdonella ginsengisoli]|uniref:BACON domain-containing protein n=1 Tax=Dokdonella ginsengisoli TaxID=363846 RepID=A0ABV9QZ36_9GAMM